MSASHVLWQNAAHVLWQDTSHVLWGGLQSAAPMPIYYSTKIERQWATSPIK